MCLRGPLGPHLRNASFAFIRFFYAPSLESQIHNTAPRVLPDEASLVESETIFTVVDSLGDSGPEAAKSDEVS